MSTPHIAILGAGPAGLACARILLHNNFDNFTIFEGEASRDSRGQGGTLDLHPKSGQLALREAGLFEEFQKNARYEGEAFSLSDKTGKLQVRVQGMDTGRPELDRVKLREILLDSLPQDKIKWGKRAKSVELGKITFQDGSEETGFDLIVGADGAWSKARHLVSQVRPFYSGISAVEINFADADIVHPIVANMVGDGSHFIFGEEDKRTLLMQRNGNGFIRVYATMPLSEEWVQNPGFDLTDDKSIKEYLLKEYAAWSDEQKKLIADFDTAKGDIVTPRALYMLPVGLRWVHVPGITLVGDAAHLMTPFAGEGVNQALQDGMELAKEILKDPSNFDSAVERYETEMFIRAKEITQTTWDNLQARFAPGALAHFKGKFGRHLKALASRGYSDEEAKKLIYLAE